MRAGLRLGRQHRPPRHRAAAPSDVALDAARGVLRARAGPRARRARRRTGGRAATRSPTPRARARRRVRDQRLARWLAHARGRDAIVWRDSVDLTRDPRSRVQALLNMAAILRSRAAQPALRVSADRPRSRAAPGVQRRGRRAPPARARRRRWECHVLDYGPGGLLGAQRDRRPARARAASRSTSARRCATCTSPGAVDRAVRAQLRRGGAARVRRHRGRAAAARGARARLLRPGGQPRARGAGAASLPRRVLPPPALGLRARGGVSWTRHRRRERAVKLGAVIAVDLRPGPSANVVLAGDVLVDTGAAARVDRAARGLPRRLRRPVSWVALTHFHADHAGGAGALGLPVAAHGSEAR